MELNTDSMRQSFQERLFFYQTAVPPDQFEDDVRSIAAVAAELVSNNRTSITINPADYGISNDAVDFLYHFNADVQDGTVVFVPGPARDAAATAFGQAAASMNGFSDLAVRFGLEQSFSSSSLTAGGMFAEVAQSHHESWDHQLHESSPLVTSTPSRAHSDRDSSLLATRSLSTVSRVSQSIPATDNRYADLTRTTLPSLPSLTGLHVVEIMEEFSYYLFTLTTRIPFRFLFKQCQRLVAEYATHNDVFKLFNVVCSRIEQTGACLLFWSSEDVMNQSDNGRVSKFFVIKSTVKKSLEDVESEQQLGRQASQHYMTIWQLKKDFTRMVCGFWQESSMEPRYVMFLFNLHEKFADLNVKWTFGLVKSLSQGTSAQDRRVDSQEVQQVLDITRRVPKIFSNLYVDALRVLRLYCSQELQGNLIEEKHISLVRWLIDHAKSNVIRPTSDEVEVDFFDVGVASQPMDIIKLLEQHGMQSTGSVYSDALEISTNLIARQGKDIALQLVLEMSKQDIPIYEQNREDQSRYLGALSGDRAHERHFEREVGTDSIISQHAYDQYDQLDSTIDPALLSSTVLVINGRRNHRSSRQGGGQRSPQMQNHERRAQTQQQQIKDAAQHKSHSSLQESDSGLVSGSSGTPHQSLTESGAMISRGVHSPSKVADDRSLHVSLPNKPSGDSYLPHDVEKDTDGDSDTGDSTCTGFRESDDDDDPYNEHRQQRRHKVLQSEYEPLASPATFSSFPSVSVAHAAKVGTVGEEEMMKCAVQVVELLKRKNFAKVNRVLKDLQGNVQQKLTLRDIGRDVLLEIIQRHARDDDLVEFVDNLVEKDRLQRQTLETVCDKLGFDVSNQSTDQLKQIISALAKET